MVVKIPWSQDEAVVLLDALIKVRNGELSRKEAVNDVSEELRQMAINKGINIDDIYRNKNVINYQLSCLEDLLIEGKNSLHSAEIFRKTIDLYYEDKNAFEFILNKVKRENSSNANTNLEKDITLNNSIQDRRSISLRDNLSYSTRFLLNPNDYECVLVSNQFLTLRLVDSLQTIGVHTVADLLRMDAATLMNMKGFCKDDIAKIYNYVYFLRKELNSASQSYAERFSLAPDDYEQVNVSDLSFSVRVENRLRLLGIGTVADLLRTTPAVLKRIRGFGKGCIDEVERYLSGLSAEQNFSDESYNYNQNNQFFENIKFNSEAAESIVLGDFSIFDNVELSKEEQRKLLKYKEARDILGEDLAFECYFSPEKISPIIQMFSDFSKNTKLGVQLRNLADSIPVQRRNNQVVDYIKLFAQNEIKKSTLLSLCKVESETINSLITSFITSDVSQNAETIDLLKSFLSWCSFDLLAEIESIFERIYTKERIKTVIQMRSRKKTLEYIGNILGVTRERVRQIEKKAKRQFRTIYSRVRILEKISAEKNGAVYLAQEDIEEYCSEYLAELLFFLREYKGASFTYDKQLDVFVLDNDSIGERVRNYVDALPDLIRASELKKIVTDASENDDLPQEMLFKAIQESYHLTGDTYHRYRLSLRAIYEEVLKKHYAGGISVYDPDELRVFRDRVASVFGDVKLPENDRALTARLADLCILCGKGRYKPKSSNYISKSLEEHIKQYIDCSNQNIFLMNSLFSVFESELLDEGIDNKYYLQGVLKELFYNEYYFRRDYLAKDLDSTSLYSSVVNYIKKSAFPVQKQQIEREFPGITPIVLAFSVKDPQVLNYFGEYLHASRLVISEDEKRFLRDILNTLVSDYAAHHSKDVFDAVNQQIPEVLSRNAAMYPFSAFSLLEYVFRDEFQFWRPYIAAKGVDIGRSSEILHDLIYSNDEFTVSDINEFCKEHHFYIQSILEYMNSCNDRFLLADGYTLISIETTGITEKIAEELENLIAEEVDHVQPISQLTCWNFMPKIKIAWTDWLVYSVLNKWGKRLTVATSANQLRHSVPLVAHPGSDNIDLTDNFADKTSKPSIMVDDLNNIDELIADIIDLDDEVL